MKNTHCCVLDSAIKSERKRKDVSHTLSQSNSQSNELLDITKATINVEGNLRIRSSHNIPSTFTSQQMQEIETKTNMGFSSLKLRRTLKGLKFYIFMPNMPKEAKLLVSKSITENQGQIRTNLDNNGNPILGYLF